MSATGTITTAKFEEAAEVPSTWALLVSRLGVGLCIRPEQAESPGRRLLCYNGASPQKKESGGKHRKEALSPPTSQTFTEAHRSQINRLFSHIKTVGEGQGQLGMWGDPCFFSPQSQAVSLCGIFS